MFLDKCITTASLSKTRHTYNNIKTHLQSQSKESRKKGERISQYSQDGKIENGKA